MSVDWHGGPVMGPCDPQGGLSRLLTSAGSYDPLLTAHHGKVSARAADPRGRGHPASYLPAGPDIRPGPGPAGVRCRTPVPGKIVWYEGYAFLSLCIWCQTSYLNVHSYASSLPAGCLRRSRGCRRSRRRSWYRYRRWREGGNPSGSLL